MSTDLQDAAEAGVDSEQAEADDPRDDTAHSGLAAARPLRATGCACLTVFFALLFLSLIVPCGWTFSLHPRFKPSAAEQQRVERMLEEYARTQWQDKVALEKLEVGVEREGSDFPFNHEWNEYRYFATLRVAGTDARFFASLPMSAQPEEIASWWSMGSQMSDEEIALLVAYSRETSTPAGVWGRDDYGLHERDYPGVAVWTVSPVALGQMFSSGSDEFLFQKMSDGSFEVLDRPE